VQFLASDDLSTRGRNVRSFLIQATVVFVAYYLAGKLGQASAARSSNLGPVWPAFGIALAVLLRLGDRMIPVLAASAFLVASQSPVPIVVAAGQALSSTFAAFSGSYVLRRFSFDCSMSRLRDALNLVLVGAILSPMVSAFLGTTVLYLGGIQPYAHIGRAWLIYWMGDGTGVLLATPLALSIGRSGLRFKFNRAAEYVVLNLLLLLPSLAIFGNLGLVVVGQDCMTFSVLPFIVWAALRFGVLGSAASTALVATVATVASAHGVGPFTQSTAYTNAVLLDVFYAVLSVTGLTLAALAAEHARANAQRNELIREQASAQAREEAENKAAVLRDQLAHLGRVDMLNALSGALAHEINQPLAAIRLNTESAKFFLAKQPPQIDALNAVLNDIQEDGKRAGEVLKRARALLKNGPVSYEKVELNTTIGDVAKLVQSNALKHGVRLDILLGSSSRPIWGDPVQIQQVVMNLLMNACEAVERVARSSRYVRLTTNFQGDMASVTVDDTGSGVSDEEMGRMFEPFYTTKQGGMGLGLGICRSIVHAHQGKLTVARNSAGGLTFTAQFPFAASDFARGSVEKTPEIRFDA
jgi:signal transduction histidine kinase